MDPVEQAVLEINRAYYEAFQSRDLAAMERIWAARAPVACLHPGLAPIFGRREVLSSFRGILLHPEAPSITCTGARAHVLGTSAFVTCLEANAGGGGPRLAATNVFTLEDGRFRLVHHQAGPLSLPERPKREAKKPPPVLN